MGSSKRELLTPGLELVGDVFCEVSGSLDSLGERRMHQVSTVGTLHPFPAPSGLDAANSKSQLADCSGWRTGPLIVGQSAVGPAESLSDAAAFRVGDAEPCD